MAGLRLRYPPGTAPGRPPGNLSIPLSAAEFYQALTLRNQGLLSSDEQQMLRRAAFLIAGCGSVGGAGVPVISGYDIAGVQLIMVHDYCRPRARVLPLG
jgi:hypothetical protein